MCLIGLKILQIGLIVAGPKNDLFAYKSAYLELNYTILAKSPISVFLVKMCEISHI